jgi:hypothetical protein
MINTKNISPKERAEKTDELRKEHQPYFDRIGKSNALFIPKMAYRPPGKDELYISFFESELKNECDIYTEFVSKQYDSEDPKRTLYLVPYNPFWKDEYEVITSNSGYERHFIPVSEIKSINTIADRLKTAAIKETPLLKDTQEKDVFENSISKTNRTNESSNDMAELIKVLSEINYSIQTLTYVIRKK